MQKVISMLGNLRMFAEKNYYVIGRNKDSEKLLDFCKSRDINILGVIDDFSGEKFFNNIPITKTIKIDISIQIINCVSSVIPIEVHRTLKSAGCKVIDLVDFYEKFEIFRRPLMCEELTKFGKPPNFEFRDEISKKQFASVMNFLLSGKTQYMKDFENNISSQYLDIASLLKPNKFIDCGGFDGDTSELFLKHITNLEKIYFFEPSPENMQKAKKRLTLFEEKISYHEYGLSDLTSDSFQKEYQ